MHDHINHSRNRTTTPSTSTAILTIRHPLSDSYQSRSAKESLNSHPTMPHFNMQHQLTTTLLNTVVSALISNSSQTKHTHHRQVIRKTEQEILLGSTSSKNLNNSKNVKTNVGKKFLNLLDNHFPCTNPLKCL